MKSKVFLYESREGWAIHDDFLQTQKALEDVVEFTDLLSSEIVHFVWWEDILKVDVKKLIGKKIICQMSAEPHRYLKLPLFSKILNVVGLWVSQSTEAEKQLTTLGFKNILIPYVVDTKIFKSPVSYKDVVEKWKIPWSVYLISNFHRDTEGSDLKSPKLVKGPDIFLKILLALNRIYNIHVILAGPRRFWLREQMTKYNINYTFVGEIVARDDITINVQPQDVINKLYNLSDLYIVSSRSEGGPRTLLEAVASKCKVISTKVGLAQDILSDKSVYKTVSEAVSIVSKDIEYGFLNDTVEAQFERVIKNNTINSSTFAFKQIYKNIDSLLEFKG